MRFVIQMRWLVVLTWIMAAVGLMMLAPDMGKLVREKGQITVPEGYSSTMAAQILNSKQTGESGGMSFALVFHSDSPLTAGQQAEIKDGLDRLQRLGLDIGVSEVMSHFQNNELKEQLVSKDESTMLALVKVKALGREMKQIRHELNEAVKDVNIEHYFTGANLIEEDVIVSSEKGLARTESITVVFILLVLILVFRSAIAPLIPLVTVGLTYVVSQSIVAFLVDTVHFPLSNFTQIFLVAILFGIGTDYCILLLSRFKEELSHNDNVIEATVNTYKTAGRTVIFSALAALVGFTSIGFAKFSLYQSAAAVAVGITVLMAALMTIVPFFMVVLGKKIFWPIKGNLQHKESRIWGLAGKLSLTRPFVSLGIVAVLVVPLLLSYNGQLSFNSLNEIGDNYDSVKGFQLIADNFGPGESMPTQIVLQHDQRLDTKEAMAVIEKVSREVAKVDNVDKVRSATRPLGEPLPDFQVASQVEMLDDGLGQGNEGIVQIRDGLKQVTDGLGSSAPEMQQANEGLGQLIEAAKGLQSGVLQLGDGLKQVEQGLRQGSAGGGELQAGLNELRIQAGKLGAGSRQLMDGYTTVAEQLAQITGGYEQLQAQLSGLTQGLAALDGSFAQLQQKYPDIAGDPDYLTIVGTVGQVKEGMGAFAAGLGEMNANLIMLSGGLMEANASFGSIVAGQEAIAQAIGNVHAGFGQLLAGIDAAADGQRQLTEIIPTIAGGIAQVGDGQLEIQQGFSQLFAQLNELNDGLTASVEGLTEISTGLASARDYLSELSSAPDKEIAGWNIPDEALGMEEFQQVFAAYMSADRMVATFDVVLKSNPYEPESLESIAGIEAAVRNALKGTSLEQAKLGIGGVSSTFADLQNISKGDYNRTVIFMLAGIFIILVVLLRSVTMPLYLIASLLVCYFSSLSVIELIFVKMLGFTGINWTLPFFGFVLIMALGVDYSIFLMDRFNEYRHLSVQEAILRAMKNMGTVIISAVIILGGTFAAMYPSGVLTLLQIATFMLTGLLLYAFVFLPLLVPVMVKLFGQGNWWPFMKRTEAPAYDGDRSATKADV